MVKFLISPGLGYRTFRIIQLGLLVGFGIAVLGIMKGSDLLGLAALEAAVLGPICGSAAYKSVGESKASGSNEDGSTNGK